VSYIVFEKITKIYKNNSNAVIKDFNLSVNKGEFIVIVGPSGSGKSTLLEMICGFEELTNGMIRIDGCIINDIEPKDRNVSMVFQNYALFPHMSVYENIAFGMKIRKEKKNVINERVEWVANILGLEKLLNTKPNSLSGGEKQRVAIGRAMVRQPKLLMMDEPLSNLDSKLRHTTSKEIINLHNKLQGTTLYVTHDQTEALTMADRIVVLNHGIIEQIGTPMDIYNSPINVFVAAFIGSPQMNLLDFEIENNTLVIEGKIVLPIDASLKELSVKEKYIIGLRAEHIKIRSEDNSLKAKIIQVRHLGSEMVLELECYGIKLTVKTYEIKEYKLNEVIEITIDQQKANVFYKKSKENIRG